MSGVELLQWFPMRVTYHRELKIKECLDKLHVENFLPMRYAMSEDEENGGKTARLVPAIHNLIFVRSSQSVLTQLKRERKELEPIRYITRPAGKGTNEILVVPDCQMENFMKVASVREDSVVYLDCDEYIGRIGKKVVITDGPFKDVVGVIKRIRKNRCFVVQIEGVAAVAITYVPKQFVTEIN